MRTKRIENYLDIGSLNLFSRQIVETLGNVISVAIHDSAGQLVWAGPDSDARDCWAVSPFLREPVPGIGFCERLSNNHFVYVFYIGGSEREHTMGTVSIQVDASHPMSLEFTHEEVAPILGCIERQLEINSELSSIRRMSKEGQRGLELLVKFDELDDKEPLGTQIEQMLGRSARHFQSEMAAVLMPDQGVQATWPASLMAETSTSRAVMTTLGGLVTAAKTHRRVLLSDANIKIRVAAGIASSDPKVLCCPILNAKDDVVGIFTLIREARFTRDDVRLAKAICIKIHALAKAANQLRKTHFTRHNLLDYIDKTLKHDPEQSHALLYVDVDKLHVINDKYGHVAGDRVIDHIQDVLDDFINKNDAVCHLSGDCFGLFLRGADEASVVDRAQLMLDAMSRERVRYETVNIEIAASIGVVLLPSVATNGAAALNTAEMAARSAKSRGGNRYVVFQDADASVAQRRTDLDQVNDLQYALIEGRFALHAQPIMSLKDDAGPARYEVLIRMLDASGETMPSASFIESAERYQMMSAIDRWVIKQTLDQLSKADNMVEVNLSRFCINVSAQSLADDDFIDFVETCVSESCISPDSLCFEITETAVVRNLERAQRFIRRLRRIGCMVALDDFGTGYCSFAYLKDLPVHYVKIDGVFVRDILQNPLSEAIIASMVEIAKVMRASTIAEHVENELIFQRMQKAGIDYAQGFGVGRPVPLADVLLQLGSPILLDDAEDSVSNAG
ncbi:MAG: bifunctional diguanylate cyclase/phosphodiesterase [Woeseiaceae bacterium]|nr:bifunctional diguanylate cyclase/phosphodiesterase [Woeseiaceae bacterium]